MLFIFFKQQNRKRRRKKKQHMRKWHWKEVFITFLFVVKLLIAYSQLMNGNKNLFGFYVQNYQRQTHSVDKYKFNGKKFNGRKNLFRQFRPKKDSQNEEVLNNSKYLSYNYIGIWHAQSVKNCRLKTKMTWFGSLSRPPKCLINI